MKATIDRWSTHWSGGNWTLAFGTVAAFLFAGVLLTLAGRK
jgi:hypothetical protein